MSANCKVLPVNSSTEWLGTYFQSVTSSKTPDEVTTRTPSRVRSRISKYGSQDTDSGG